VVALEVVAVAVQGPHLSAGADVKDLPPEDRSIERSGPFGVTRVETVQDERPRIVDQLRALVLLRLPDAEGCSLGIGKDSHPARVHEVERLGHHGSAGIADLGRGRIGAVDPEIGVPHRRWRRCVANRSDSGDIAAARAPRRVKDRRAGRLRPCDEVLVVGALRHHVLELPAEETAVEVDRCLGIGFARVHPAWDAGDVSVTFGHRYLPSDSLTPGRTLSSCLRRAVASSSREGPRSRSRWRTSSGVKRTPSSAQCA
jgi:hypothetical protein